MEENDFLQLITQVSLVDDHFLDKNVVWERIAAKAQAPAQPVVSRGLRVYWRIAGSVAAAVCFLLIGLWAFVDVKAEDGIHSYLFPDGSSVELAENSSVDYNRIGWLFTRRVKLDGDASFDVVKGKGTFIVDTDCGSITVLGTQFLVKQSDESLLVSCIEGKVEVATTVGKEAIVAGEKVEYSNNQMVVTQILPDYLEFNNADLSDIVSQVEQIFGLTIMNKEACKGYSFSGWVSTTDVQEAVEVILRSCDIDYTLENNNLVIK